MKKLNLTTAALCLTFLMGGAWAGELTGFFAAKKIVNVNEPVSLWVTGTAKCGVMIDDGNGNKWPIALTDPSPQPSKSFGVTYDHPGIFVLKAGSKLDSPTVCAPQAAPLMLQIEVLGAVPEATKPGTPPKTFVPASTTPAKPTPPCAKDEVAQTRMLQAGVRVEICPPTKPTTPTCAPDKAAQARQLKAGNKVDICEPPKSDTPPTCFKSKAEQSEYSKKNNPKTVPPICK